MKKIPFYVPLIEQSEKNLVEEVLKLKGASKIEELEDLMCEYTGSTYAISTSSWSGAIHLSMFALGLKRGDKILCSVNAHPAIPEAVRHFDAEPIFVDIEPETFNISVDALKKALVEFKHKKLKAVIISHIGGVSCELDEIYKIASENKIKVIEDASTSLGATYKGKMVGNSGGDMVTFSFGSNLKNPIINCGIITTNDKSLYERAKLIRHHSIESKEWDKSGTLGYIYDVNDVGIKYDTSELEAAFSIAKLQRADELKQRRREIAEIYFKELEGVPHITLPQKSDEHTYGLFTIKIDKN
jgi:dTDP-4-amino-4,6-dideoxygalactose transaminase